MQGNPLKLREIIWEVTGFCKNSCDYCGSKIAWSNEINQNKIISIVQEIAKFPPEQLDVSGGDPLLLDVETHRIITSTLKSAGVHVKVLFNPQSFLNVEKPFTKLSLYDHIGCSINSEEELNLFEENVLKYQNKDNIKPNYVLQHITIITNFNIKNIFLYENIEKLVKKLNCLWMIQYTVYEDENSTNAIYNNDSAQKFLQSLVSRSTSSGVKIIISDNMNNFNCSAGTSSIGILDNGDVVPCLSMRSWNNLKEMEKLIQGNILDHTEKNKIGISNLQYLWENEFKNYRFSNFKCCKDHCKNKCLFTMKPNNIFNPIPINPLAPYPDLDNGNGTGGKPWSYPHVTAYSVTDPNRPIVCYYAVSSGYTNYDSEAQISFTKANSFSNITKTYFNGANSSFIIEPVNPIETTFYKDNSSNMEKIHLEEDEDNS